MNYTKTIQRLRTPVLTAAALALLAGPSLAFDLMAVEGTWTPAGGTPITMWGFAAGTSCPVGLVGWDVGPQLTDADLADGNLTINLLNCLSEPVSIIIPGQPATFTPVRVNGRVTAFTTETSASGGTASYTWSGVNAGTYLYQSGSHPAKQVQMGLYGALTILNNSGDPSDPMYPGTNGDVTLLYSEIDPALHSPPAAATPLGYHPRHYLVNGSESPSNISAGDTNQPTVLRFLNAGLDFHVPTLNGSYMSLVAEDGYPYPFPKKQYSANLAAGKTIDALWQPASDGDYVIYDRRGNGMVATLTVAAGGGNNPPVANDDAYGAVAGITLIIDAPGVLGNDTDGDSDPLTAVLANGTTGVLRLNPDGSFGYLSDTAGTDSFTYFVNDGTENSAVAATVTINITGTTNIPPVVSDDTYDAVAGITLIIDAPGVLGNDTDGNGDPLTAVLANGTTGTLRLNPDGSFDYLSDTAGTDSFTYFANDGTENSAVVATVTINIAGTTNNPPVAVPDNATIPIEITTFINLTGNDSDPESNLKDEDGDVAAGQITKSNITGGHTVTVVTNGIDFTPRNKNFVGVSTFTYTVTDLAGAVSNEATVMITVE